MSQEAKPIELDVKVRIVLSMVYDHTEPSSPTLRYRKIIFQWSQEFQ